MRRELDPDARRKLGWLIWAFIRAGWNPPTPSARIARAVAEDMEKVELAYTGLRNTPTHRYGEGLSERQFQVLYLAAEGLTEPEMAARLGIGRDSVKTHAKAVRRKMEAKSMSQAVAEGFRRGIL